MSNAMPRVLRTTLPDGYFHVIARGVDGCAIFRDDSDRRTFLAHLRTRAESQRWVVHALCLMTTHYHLVLHSTRVELSRGVQRLNGRYAKQFNERHVRFGHLFADRFTSRVIESETPPSPGLPLRRGEPRAGAAMRVGQRLAVVA